MSYRNVICIVIALIGIYLPSLIAIRDPLRPPHNKIVVCYVASWAQYRPGKGQFVFENFQPNHCTHVIYSFAGLNVTTSTIRSLDPWADLEDNYGKGTYKKMTTLRRQYPHLKVSLAIGGWNEGSANYSALAASPQKRSTFVSSVVEFLKTYKFDGLDLDWEFPSKRGGASHDKINFLSLIMELRDALNNHDLLLTAAISANKKTIDTAYDIMEISKYLDFINVMAYDYHGAWDGYIAPNAPLKCNDELCIESTVNHLLHLGAPAEKLVLGLAMYGRTFILTTKLNDTESPIGRPSLNRGFQGNYTREDGFMGYNEICEELVRSPNSWRTGKDKDENCAWAVHDDKVVVYDNLKTIKKKVLYAKKTNLAGVMVWSIDTDDFTGECASLYDDILDPLTGTNYPLMRAINSAFIEASLPVNVDNPLNIGDFLGRIFALISLTPFAIVIGFITLILFRRDLHTICYFIGIIMNEVVGLLLKYTIKEARPMRRDVVYVEYGMPSAHSQFMWFFTTYTTLFVCLRMHLNNNSTVAERLWRWTIIVGCAIMAFLVTLSRIYLQYHTISQVFCGFIVGMTMGFVSFFIIHLVLTPFFPVIVSWRISEYLLLRDTTLIPNVLWFEYTNIRTETRARSRKLVSMKSQ